MRRFGRQGPAGAEGIQHPGGSRAGGLLVGSSAPVTRPERASVPQPSSSACNSSSQGGPGTGRCRRREGGILARLPSGSCLAADGGFAFRERPAAASPGARALHRPSRLAPGELWLCLMWWQGFQRTAGTMTSETRIFSSRLCGSFIKNRQINKQIAAH